MSLCSEETGLRISRYMTQNMFILNPFRMNFSSGNLFCVVKNYIQGKFSCPNLIIVPLVS